MPQVQILSGAPLLMIVLFFDTIESARRRRSFRQRPRVPYKFLFELKLSRFAVKKWFVFVLLVCVRANVVQSMDSSAIVIANYSSQALYYSADETTMRTLIKPVESTQEGSACMMFTSALIRLKPSDKFFLFKSPIDQTPLHCLTNISENVFLCIRQQESGEIQFEDNLISKTGDYYRSLFNSILEK